jgi:hypothetical protein
MTSQTHSTWISFGMAPLLGINACGYGADRKRLRDELACAEEMLRGKPRNSVLVDMDIAQTELLPELVEFLRLHSGGPEDPIRKLAIIGVPGFKQWWYAQRKAVVWPKHARFFDEHEKAKRWLIAETW